MSLKLNLQLCPILKNPLHDIGIWRYALDSRARGQSGPEGAEGFEFDEVPDRAEGCGDDS